MKSLEALLVPVVSAILNDGQESKADELVRLENGGSARHNEGNIELKSEIVEAKT